MTLCELSKDFGRYRNQVISVRGVYYNGLRDTCTEKCRNGPWPSFIDLVGTSAPAMDEVPPSFDTDEESWASLYQAQQKVQRAATEGRRLEVWVTVSGQLRTKATRPPGGPCALTLEEFSEMGGYPAKLEVQHFRDIQIKENPRSAFDYNHMYSQVQ